MDEKTKTRERNIQKKIWINQEELQQIYKRMEESNIQNFGVYARK